MDSISYLSILRHSTLIVLKMNIYIPEVHIKSEEKKLLAGWLSMID